MSEQELSEEAEEQQNLNSNGRALAAKVVASQRRMGWRKVVQVQLWLLVKQRKGAAGEDAKNQFRRIFFDCQQNSNKNSLVVCGEVLTVESVKKVLVILTLVNAFALLQVG